MDKCYECNCTIMVKVGEGFEMRCILPRCKEDVKNEMEKIENEFIKTIPEYRETGKKEK